MSAGAIRPADERPPACGDPSRNGTFPTTVSAMSQTTATFGDDELIAYLDELLPVDRMAEIETQLRTSESLRRRLSQLLRHRDAGVHTVGEMWRRARLSCPSRSQLGNYLLGTLTPGYLEYIKFHIRVVGCRLCAANLLDLQRQTAAQSESQTESQQRRRKFFESSAGLLPK